MPTGPSRLLLVGWDAADWRFAEPLIEKGLMPTLAALRARGAWGNLSTLQPALSPMLWTSIATGKRPSKHGIHGFVEPLPDGSGVRPVTSTSRRCKALWNIAHDAERTAIAVGWYASHPAEPVRGAVVSNQFELPVGPLPEAWPVPDGSVHPPNLAATLAPLRVHPGEIDAGAILPFVPRAREIDPTSDPRLGRLRQLIAQTASVQAVFTHLIEHEPWDLAAVYFEGIDRFGHEFMAFHPPTGAGVSERDAALYQHVMTGCYRWHDMILQRLLDLAGDDCNVLLVSDHGYRHGARRPPADADPQAWHRGHGIAVAAGSGIDRDTAAEGRLFGATVLDVTPTALALLGLPAGRDMDGRAWAEVLRSAPPLPIETWEPPARVDPPPRRSPPAPDDDPSAAREALRQLAALGYLDSSAVEGAEAASRAASIARFNLAISLTDEGRYADAAEVLNRLIASHPDEPQLRLQRAICRAAAGDLEAARGEAEALVSRPACPTRARVLLAALEAEAGRHAVALGHLQEVLRADPDEPDVLVRIGQVYLSTARPAEASEAFARAVGLDPEHAVAHDGLAAAALQQDDFAGAATHALEAVSLAHFLPRAHFHLATALERLGRPNEAIAAARVCLHQAPGHAPARQLLARLLEAAGFVAEAASHRAMLRNPG